MPEYVYRGTVFDAHIIEPPRKTRIAKNPAKCGTPGGYRKHLRDGTPICEPCLTGNRTYERERRRRRTQRARAA
jgi:hypothetical protein